MVSPAGCSAARRTPSTTTIASGEPAGPSDVGTLGDGDGSAGALGEVAVPSGADVGVGDQSTAAIDSTAAITATTAPLVTRARRRRAAARPAETRCSGDGSGGPWPIARSS